MCNSTLPGPDLLLTYTGRVAERPPCMSQQDQVLTTHNHHAGEKSNRRTRKMNSRVRICNNNKWGDLGKRNRVPEKYQLIGENLLGRNFFNCPAKTRLIWMTSDRFLCLLSNFSDGQCLCEETTSNSGA